ncbi:hypothetical protein PS623_04559 [Pseudomonas fluorescens]|nr:hypothetical protein PS623_04559 [Pseudomonas fluorescens]
MLKVGRADQRAQHARLLLLAAFLQLADQLAQGVLALVIDAQQGRLLFACEVVIALRLAFQRRPPFTHTVLAGARGGVEMSDAGREVPDDDRHGLFQHPRIVLRGSGIAGDPLHVDILKKDRQP